MLQKTDFEIDDGEQDRSHLLRPGYYWDLIRRRWLAFLGPFVIVAAAGIAAAMLWPATYLAEGKILVESQQIPTELVRPTVTSAAQERIQVIEQRTMTRDNLVAIADKFDLFPDKRPFLTVTELVELMRKSAKIVPVDMQLDFKQRTRLDNPTIVFSVGFEYRDAAIAARVANELVTRILSEDLRDRTSRATDTTKFLEREVQKLQADSDALDARIAKLKAAQAKTSSGTAPDQPATLLSQLRAELAQKSAVYTERHPVLQSLKRQIESMEHAASPAAKEDGAAGADLEALTAQQETLQKNLDTAITKRDAARLGESLEKNQQSEKLEVIEQPTAPQTPVRPNRPKVAGLAILLALAAGLGLAVVAEMTDKAIRRPADLFSAIDSHLIVAIPYITTRAEQRGARVRLVVALVLVAALVVGAAVAAYAFLPLDLMIAKARVGLFR
ncbi:MAG: sugar transporter [Xanthobacteraceae bacterium]|nr:sugar transporter [Xanthobacteraceae bacterium]